MGIVSNCRSACIGVPMEKEGPQMHNRKIAWMTGFIITMLIVYAVGNLILVRSRLIQADVWREELTQKTAALQRENERLEQEIRDAETDAVIEEIARTRLGLVKPGEIIFSDINS